MLSNGAAVSFQPKIGGNIRTQSIYKIVGVLFGGIFMYQTISYTQNLSQGFITWNNAQRNYQYGDYKAAILEYELAYPFFKKDGDFLMNYGKNLTIVGKYNKAIAVLEQAKHYQNNTVIATSLGDSYKVTKQYDKAEANYKQAINMIPSRFYAPFLLAKLYDESKKKEKAVALAQKILKKEIKIHSTAIEEIQIEMKKILAKYKKTSGT